MEGRQHRHFAAIIQRQGRPLAAQARDAAESEESRRSQLAQQRIAEEQALAKLQAQKAVVAAKPTTASPTAPVATVTTPATPAVKAAFVKDITFKGDYDVHLDDNLEEVSLGATFGTKYWRERIGADQLDL